jgi:hypothetical protein
MMLIDFSTPCLNYRERTLPLVWPLTPDCPDNFENGKFMLPLGTLLKELWEIRRFHLWYMYAAKLGMKEFVSRVPKEYFHLEDDCYFSTVFHDMHRLLWRKDLNIAQLTLFAM